MTISTDRMLRLALLTLSAGLWITALPAVARGIIDPAFTTDLLTAGSLCVGAILHTLSLILLASMFERSWRKWP